MKQQLLSLQKKHLMILRYTNFLPNFDIIVTKKNGKKSLIQPTTTKNFHFTPVCTSPRHSHSPKYPSFSTATLNFHDKLLTITGRRDGKQYYHPSLDKLFVIWSFSFKFCSKLLQPFSLVVIVPEQSMIDRTIIFNSMYLLPTKPSQKQFILGV